MRIKVIKALYAHFKSESDSLVASEKTLSHSIDKCYDLYHQMLWLVVDVACYAEERIELARKKKLPTEEELNPNMRFVRNRVIARIADSEDLSLYMDRRALGWTNHPELIKHLYNRMIESDYYKAYMAKPTASFKDDAKLVEDFYIETVDDDFNLCDVVEEQSVLWADDVDFALIMVVKTIGDCRASQEELVLLPKFKNDDDADFYKELFRKTLVNFGDYMECIKEFTQNWDVDRIAFMDNIIMATALAELSCFQSIPVKVTLDEYIEIAKYYSTPSSSQFINGILDKAIARLTEEGKINKSGRGLL